MLSTILKFKNWAEHIPAASRSGEWECDYPDWSEIYTQIAEFVISKDFCLWSEDEITDILYIIGRDNETQELARVLAKDSDRLIGLLQQCLQSKESEAKWQLIVEAGELKEWSPILEKLIYCLYFDKDYYVQRRALMELAKKQSKYTLELAQYSWETQDEYQRISALQALHDLNYEGIGEFLDVALKSDQKHLVLNAERIHNEQNRT